jgi:hypothetical protein
VDESGNGKPYAGLPYKLVDSAEQSHEGILDSEGFAKVCDYYEGPVILTVDSAYKGDDTLYKSLMTRPSYPLKITELQVRAETTRFIRKDGLRAEDNPAKAKADQFFHIEVQHLVQKYAHLPPESKSKYPPNHNLLNLMGSLWIRARKNGPMGSCLTSEQAHHS